MRQFVTKIQNFKKKLREQNNATELKSLHPINIIYDMCHHFSNQTNFHSSAVIGLFDTKTEQKVMHCKNYIYAEAYQGTLPQNKVFIHGMLFKAIFDIYMEHFKKGFDNVLLSDLSEDVLQGRPIIDYFEYEKMPKKYHGIFIPYDNDHYVLNTSHSNMIMSYKNSDKPEIEKLLLRAKVLIASIYKSVGEDINNKKSSHTIMLPDIDFGGTLQIFEQVPQTEPIANSARKPGADLVSDEQLSNIRELHDIFVNLSKITLPIMIKAKKESAAKQIYDEYVIETENQGRFLKALDTVKMAKTHKKTAIANAKKAYKKQIASANQSYKDFHDVLIQMLAKGIIVQSK